ncbi:hypothetical protein PHYSODRAFT_470265 [Phytophthora sojae]|uniref:SWIM-type domain-containing protein n=1 Tax=Phytophthora sojae (strain P6497) TaxID=1094619 RepID=G4YFY9_PHYSP|nr:hypothetical protein PHYSODRAFT_470265 [Phytophthora sojae]EGZ30780.1 hypothetical protein PHYSODRAFT_470265 [Phytophthora sojae]|eukprot:XP_009518055.1 hypothetical protein PHYSODRAFT_470265 [Phytophthora sojae]
MHSKTFKSIAEALHHLQSRENTAFRERSLFLRTTVLVCASHVDCKAQVRVTKRDGDIFTLSTSGYHTRHLLPSSPDHGDLSDPDRRRLRSSKSGSDSPNDSNDFDGSESEFYPDNADFDDEDDEDKDTNDVDSDTAAHAISHVLAVTLPKIVIHCGRDTNTEFLWPFASGPREIANINRYYFNADYYLIHDENLYGQKVTHTRTSRYAKSFEGVLKKDEVVNSIQLSYQSLHAVDIVSRTPIEHDWASPMWTIEEIRAQRSKFKCDCKEFYQTGWLCGHVMACLKLVDGLDFSLMLRGLLMRRPTGRPRKKKQCLEREKPSPGQYSVDALISWLIKTPASVINWSVLSTWPTKNRDGEIEDRDLVGVVDPPFMKGGARYWDVYYEKRSETVTMAAEELANAINYAHRMGHHIVPPRN